ncbi:MAG: response regulator [Coriobacteriia bacterium]|nr:response regulator [Coriobacteriia bacterium]
MFGKRFELNEQTLNALKQIGGHMPGGFFVYQADGDQPLLFANNAVCEIFGCADIDEFAEYTGFVFKGMIHPDDYQDVKTSVAKQPGGEERLDHVEYRIIRKDGAVRWVDDYGHYTETETYGGIHYVFVSDITETRERMESDLAMRQAVIEALSESYHTVWLIKDVETETFSLYRGDVKGETAHAAPIQAALNRMKYSQAKQYYIASMVAKSDQARLQEELSLDRIVARLGETPRFNVNYLRAMDDGSERYFRIEFAKLDMPGGKMGVVCGFKDVDDEVREQQAIQKALRDAQRAEADNRRLIQEAAANARIAELTASVSSLLTNMPAMTFSKDVETGRYLACNQAYADYAHKATPEGVIGLADDEIFDAETARSFVESDRRALEMDDPYVYIEDVLDAAGENIRHLQTTKLKYVDATGRHCLLGMCVDVTEMTRLKTSEATSRVREEEGERRRVLQEQLQEQEEQAERQQKLITALAADYWSVYYIELDRNHGTCYQAHADVDGGFKVGEEFPYLEAVTAYANQYITDAYRDEFLKFVQPENIRAALANERVIGFRYMVHRHGQDSYEMVRFAGVRHPEDRDDHIVHNVGACFTDVDAETRRQLEQSQALVDALETAEQANKAKTAFLSNMSHEIRTPMNAIIGLNNIAMNDSQTPPKTMEYLEKIGSSARHLLGIINDILDMSRIESGRMVVKNEEFSLPKALEQVNTMIGGQCREKGLEYECHIKGAVQDYYIGDEMKLRQVMINILGNAVKFTPEGGQVHFEIGEVARFDGKATLRFCVSDTGIGMSEDYLPHIFDAFSQEDSSATNKFGSTGLGMPITKSIVELMNGHIEVESEKGVGTTFTVTVTLAESNRQSNAVDAGDVKPHELTVLVIDDDPIACEHAQIVLGQVGISCETAQSGAEGVRKVELRHVRRDAYDLILVDWKMPGMDGVETTRRIRQIVGHDTAIVILTSYNWDDIADEARDAGVDSFVPKPLFAGTVLDEFREAFRRKNEVLLRGKADLTGRRVLLAEDMAVNAEIMVMVLSMREIDVDVAENGRIAVDLFASHPAGYYDAVLMDMRMPEMDGLEATRTIRAMDRPDAQAIPIIALTANAFDEDVQRSMQAGLNAHLSKPVEAEVLFDTLESLIP